MADASLTPPIGFDPELARVIATLSQIKNFEARAAVAVRQAVDEVLRGPRTCRFSIHQLTKQEKAHIGTQIEIAFLLEFFDLREGERLDTTIDGVEVDIKNTIGSNWMIPREAVGQLCLLVRIDEDQRCFSVGVVRTTTDILNRPNQDGKRSLNSRGAGRICWLLRNSALPVSIFLRIGNELRDEIWTQGSTLPEKRRGQVRITHLFRVIQNEPILRSDIATLARQLDPTKRVRDARKKLRKEGLLVLSGRYDGPRARHKGFDLRADEWITLPE